MTRVRIIRPVDQIEADMAEAVSEFESIDWQPPWQPMLEELERLTDLVCELDEADQLATERKEHTRH